MEMKMAEATKYLEERAANIRRCSDKLRAAIQEIEHYLCEVAKQTGIPSLTMVHLTTFKDTQSEMAGRIIMQLRKHSDGYIYLFWKDYNLAVDDYNVGLTVEQTSRAGLMEAVKELPAFIFDYAKTLETEGKLISGFADKAKQIADIILTTTS